MILVEGAVPRTLNEPPAWRVIARRRDRSARALRQPIDRLHERLPERRLSDDERTIVILQRAGDNLGGARAGAAHQRHHRQIQILTRFGRAVILIGIRNAAARVHDQVALGQEAVRHLDRLIERAAGIAAQVEDQTLHALLRELAQCSTQFRIGVLPEVLKLDVASRRVQQDRGGDRRNVDFIPHDGKLDGFVVGGASNRDVHRRALGSAQLSHRLFGVPALGRLALDEDDDVATAQTSLVRGRAFEDVEDGDVAIDDVDGDAQAVVAAFLALTHLGKTARVHEARMRIERLEHPGNGAVDQPVGLHLADVLLLDGLQSGRKYLVLVGNLVLRDQRRPAEEPPDYRRDRDDRAGRRQRANTPHILRMYTPHLDPVQKGFL